MTRHRSARPIAQHSSARRPRAWARALRALGIALAVVLVSTAAVVGYVVSDLTAAVAHNSVQLEGGPTTAPDIGAYKNGFNLLVVGIDACEPKYADLFPGRCDGPDASSVNNDVTVLMHVSNSPRRITVVSFPRDMIVPVPSCTTKDGTNVSAQSAAQINTTYDEGGLSCVAKTVSALSGQQVDFAAAVNFGTVIDITNAIGGVQVCLATPIDDAYTGLNLSTGEHTIQGLQALQFLRTRHGLVSGSDLARIGNQQQYLASLARQLTSGKVLSNVPEVLKIATIALTNLEASTTLKNPATILQLALAVKDVQPSDITFIQYPNVTDPDNPNRVIPDAPSAQTLWSAVAANQPVLITHQNTVNDGVTVEPTTPTDAPTPGPAGSAAPTSTPTPAASAVPLSDNVRGSTAAQQTCTNGDTSG
ncbi:LCP family protein [Microbacterium sp. Au-Mic1]|uniref:LCP family protein n=1 Tax=Microbacterium sp. Au-Mic1 TaxID=2906457 RepID=UPI001E55D3F6|nr:LCP family protein [Microbacterium sp. Au-Mic1]MCE4024747.1 LCP family protein [Microbacterium sp. Au-Mic1]